MKESYQIATALYEAACRDGLPANRCHLCGGVVDMGLQGCFETMSELVAAGYTDPARGRVTFLVVDAHALQHPEIHGKRNNVGHMLHLCWQLEHGGPGNPPWWQRYLERADIPCLGPPPPGERGTYTVAELRSDAAPGDYAAGARRYALSVWEDWSGHHRYTRQTLLQVVPPGAWPNGEPPAAGDS